MMKTTIKQTIRRLGAVLSLAFASIGAYAADWTDNQGNEYTALAAIQSTATTATEGGAWIVTDITPTDTDIVRTKFKINDTSHNNAIWCARTSGSKQTFSCFFIATSTIRLDRNSNTSNQSYPGDVDFTVEANYGTREYKINGTTGSGFGATGSYTVGSPLMFFGANSGVDITENIAATKVANRGSHTLYWFQLYDSTTGALKHNLMPAQRVIDGEAGLYDTVTGKFYAKAVNSPEAFATVAKVASAGRKWTGLGGDGLMSNPANWEGNTVPADGEALDFTLAPAFAAITADIGGTHDMWVSETSTPDFTGYTGQAALTFKSGTATFQGDCNTWNAKLALDGGSLDVNGTFRVANVAGANDVVNVAYGKLYSGSNMSLGQNGTATVTVGANGWVKSGNGLYIGNNATGDGIITVDGGKVETVTSLNIGNSSGAKGTLTLNDGILTVGTIAYVGNNGTGEVTVNGGSATIAGEAFLGRESKSKGTLTVNGGSVTLNDNLYVGNSGTGTLTINGGTVELRNTDKNLNLATAQGSTGTINLNGGTLVTRRIYKNNGTATINFNGGTLKANAAPNLSGGLLPGGTVKVGAGGGTIDCGGFDITIGLSLGQSGDTGGLNFTGGNGNTIKIGNFNVNYTGATSIAPGTTLTCAQWGGSKNIVQNGIIVSGVPTPGESVFICTRGGDYNLTDTWASYSDKVTCPIAPETEFELVDETNIVVKTVGALLPGWYIGPADGDLSVAANWSDGAVPGPGTNAVISCKTSATLTKGGSFAPSSITFAPGSAPVTINGGDLTGIVAVTNLSSISHIINAKVYFTGDIQVSQPAMGGDGDLTLPHVTFAGGAYAVEGCALENASGSGPEYSRCVFGEYFLANDSSAPWTVTASTQASGKRRIAVADNSILHIPYAGALGTIYVGNGAKVYVENWTTAGNQRLSYRNYGEMIAGNLTLTGSDDSYATHGQGTSSTSVFKFRSVVNSKTGTNRFRMGDADGDARQEYWIGEGGLTFSGSAGQYIVGRDSTGNYATIRPWNADFTIAGKGDNMIGIYLLGNIDLNTDDENGVGRTVTVDAVTVGRTTTVLTVSGKGTLKVNKGNKNDSGNPTVILAGTATLEYTAATADLGAASIALGAGTTFAFVNSGSVLALPSSITLPTDGVATLCVNGDRLASGKHTIATGVAADAADHLVVDSAGAALGGRKATLAVEDGNLVLNVQSAGLMVIFK